MGWARHGHFLDADAVERGRNFVTPEAWQAARKRAAWKGVAERTFENMLSSQAMCFNVFAPLASRPSLATKVLASQVPGLKRVRSIAFEYTPPADVFKDQSGRGGVDCDLLVEAEWDDDAVGVIAVETKFVEPEFSRCGFRKAGRKAKGEAYYCPDTVDVRDDSANCLYERNKGYLYWKRTREHETISQDAVPASGCPFKGVLWQLWVNHTLAHVEASRRQARHARYAVCAPANNDKLLKGGSVIDQFKALTTDPQTVLFIDLNELIGSIHRAVGDAPELQGWAQGIVARYANI